MGCKEVCILNMASLPRWGGVYSRSILGLRFPQQPMGTYFSSLQMPTQELYLLPVLNQAQQQRQVMGLFL